MLHRTSSRALLLAAASSAAIVASPAWPAENSPSLAESLALEPLEYQLDAFDVRLGGFAGGAFMSSSRSGGPAYPGFDRTGASAIAGANLRLQRILDNGMILGARSDLLLYHDRLSDDAYDADTVQQLFVFAQTGFGRVEIGQTDGAAYAIGLTGPEIARNVTLENPNISLFRDPLTGENFTRPFQATTAVQSSSNFAKINYVSPRLFGIQIGASFTPGTIRTPLPFTGNPSAAADSQQNIWEIAGGYTTVYSGLALGLSAGYARGALKNATAGGADLYDGSLGAQLAYSLGMLRLSLGGAYRNTNAYLLNVQTVLNGAETQAGHVSATAEWGSWRLGGEYAKADTRGPTAYRIIGHEAALAYQLNDNLELAAGWQWQNFQRSAGSFANGLADIAMNAGFLSLSYAL
jgi:outer membrane protein OmpU